MLKDSDFAHFQKTCAKYKTTIVDAFLVNDSNDAILLQKRSATRKLFPNFWDAFGGHLDDSESIKEALIREVKEESTMDLVEVLALVHQFEWPDDPTVINLQFLCRAKGTLVLEREKATEARWIRPTDLAQIEQNLSEVMKEGVLKAFTALAKLKKQSKPPAT